MPLPQRALLEGLCFHAQQAAEKSLKAVLVHRGIPFPKTHNLRTLLDLLPKDMAMPAVFEEIAKLTDYVVLGRYPAAVEPVDMDEYREAIALAEVAVSWAREVTHR
jgi:HEPN domain-containing protein